MWTNILLVDTSTNTALLLTNWVVSIYSQFDWMGNFTFTNAISPTRHERLSDSWCRRQLECKGVLG